MSHRDLDRAEQLTSLLNNPKKGVEFGTRRALTSNILLTTFQDLDLITIDNYVAMPWITPKESQSDKHNHFKEAVAVLNNFSTRCTLWTFEARAASMILRGYKADFVYTDISYGTQWSYKHLPMLLEILKKGGVLCGGGWHRYKFKRCVSDIFTDVQGSRTLWWKIA